MFHILGGHHAKQVEHVSEALGNHTAIAQRILLVDAGNTYDVTYFNQQTFDL
jgi:hypothetical protein